MRKMINPLRLLFVYKKDIAYSGTVKELNARIVNNIAMIDSLNCYDEPGNKNGIMVLKPNTRTNLNSGLKRKKDAGIRKLFSNPVFSYFNPYVYYRPNVFIDTAALEKIGRIHLEIKLSYHMKIIVVWLLILFSMFFISNDYSFQGIITGLSKSIPVWIVLTEISFLVISKLLVKELLE